MKETEFFDEVIEFDNKTEIKFFTFVNVLCKSQESGEVNIKEFKNDINDYERDVTTLIAEGEAENKVSNPEWRERKDHLDNVKKKLLFLKKICNN